MRSDGALLRGYGFRLDAAQRTEVLRRPRLRPALQIAANLGVYAAAAMIVTTDRLGLWRFAMWLLMGLVLAGFMAAAHDCFHGTLLQSKRANRVAGALWCAVLLSNFTALKYAHLVHHRFTGVEGDSEKHFVFASAGAYCRFLLFSCFLVVRGPFRAAAILVGRGEPPYLASVKAQRGARVDSAVVLVWFALVVALTCLAPRFMALAYWVPLALFPPFALAVAIPEHYGCARSSNLLAAARSTKSNSLLRMLVWNSNYHVEHHLHPGVPSCNLPTLHRVVESELQHCGPGYLAFHIGVVRDLMRAARREPDARESDALEVPPVGSAVGARPDALLDAPQPDARETYHETKYLTWANRYFGTVTHNLARAGARPLALRDLGIPAVLDDPGAWAELRGRIARYNAVDAGDVVPALGTTHALWLAFAALVRPGDDVLVEHPAYEPLWRIPEGMGANIRRFERRLERGFAVGADAIAAQLTPRTRVVVMTSPHNPTGARACPETLREIAAHCARAGATLLVDEVFAPYGSILGSDGVWGASSRRLAPNIVAVSGLSKAYGLGALRVGWLAADPAVARRAEHALQSNLCDPPLAQACLAVHAFSQLHAISLARESHFRPELRAVVGRWIAARPQLAWHEPEHGPYGFVNVRGAADLTAAIERGAERHDVLVAPGSFFGVPGSFRLGWAVDPQLLPEALERLDRVLALTKTTSKIQFNQRKEPRS